MVESKKGNIYFEEDREEMVDNDEISAEEEGFMLGYQEPDSFLFC
ncbi:MAG: hypothetical protein PHT54_04600 [Candidatus Nanoarchaeia archaeon]|nr:hypothetical protein [Candidatus Nanoarchaeia archaeon]